MASAPLVFFDDRIPDRGGLDPEFIIARKANVPGWRWLEEEWEQYRPLCPDSERAFLGTARKHFRGARWQMHCTLVASGLRGFAKGSGAGPDFYVGVGNTRCGVECTAIRLNSDYPPNLPRPGQLRSGVSYGSGPPYNDYRAERLGDALRTKRKRRERHIKSGLIQEDEPYVIAISLGDLDWVPDELPDGLRVCYGIGNLVYVQPVSLQRGVPPMKGHYERPLQLSVKASANATAQDNAFFRDPDSEGISGIIYSPFCHDAYMAGKDGRELTFVHNVNAANPVPAGTFPFGQEWGRVGDKIAMIRDWRKADGMLDGLNP